MTTTRGRPHRRSGGRVRSAAAGQERSSADVCQQELRRAFPADCIAGDQSRGKLVDDGTDHRVQVGDFVMQFDVAPAH